MTQPAQQYDYNACPNCGGELDYESGDPGAFDEPESVGVTTCLNPDCNYRLEDADEWERAVEQADERHESDWLAEHAWERQAAESD